MSANEYDAIIVGGGHNGLVCGAYFARAGARAVVLEARAKTGGAADTSAPFAGHPEIRVSTYAYVMSLMPRTIIEELELARVAWRLRKLGVRGIADVTRPFTMSVSDLLDEREDFVAAIERWKTRSGVVKINLVGARRLAPPSGASTTPRAPPTPAAE